MQSKRSERGFVPESIWLKSKDYEFGRKKEPSKLLGAALPQARAIYHDLREPLRELLPALHGCSDPALKRGNEIEEGELRIRLGVDAYRVFLWGQEETRGVVQTLTNEPGAEDVISICV